MANERQFNFNRITLYLIYLFSLCSPMGYDLAIQIFSSTTTFITTEDIDLTGMSTGLIIEDKQPIWVTVLLWIYVAGVSFTTIRFFYSIIKIINIIRKGKQVDKYGSYHLIISDHQDISPFSFLIYTVISEDDYNKSFSSILLHEQTHLRKRHWIDLIIANIVAIFQWYNPAAWLMIEEFKTLHEYQADEMVIKSGTDMKQYQYLLIEKTVGERLPSPANSLNHSKLKKRVTMMYKSKPHPLRRMASLATIPALFAGMALVNLPAVASVLSETREATMLNNQSADPTVADTEILSESREYVAESIGKITTFSEDTENNVAEKINISNQTEKVFITQETADNHDFTSNKFSESVEVSTLHAESVANDKPQQTEVFVAVEKMAEFPGGQMELMKFLMNNVKYPENAFKNDIQGRVIVKFIIAKNGKIESPTIVKSVDPELDAEAIRVVKEMPDWIPATNDGKPVASWFNVPITFKITDDQKTDNNSETKK
ncbi:MAG: M56 family metallopeptidase [Bacteroides sp.]|nr:M56 family metallopeptidase [Bacteroides sp.]